MRSTAALLTLALALPALPASAYEERLHALLSRRSPPLPLDDEVLTAPGQASLDAFRQHLWYQLASIDDEEVRRGFLRLAPGPEALTAKRLKELMQLDSSAAVHGIDSLDVPALAEVDLLAAASRWPDDDRRNQNRFARSDDGRVQVGPDGTELPADPAVLHMGSASGTSSQAHAHYQLLPAELRTDAVEVLKTDPGRFSMPRAARTFGADFAALYSDLATIAAHAPIPEGRWLSRAFFGAAQHHVQDVCNQIHTLQVGGYDFFFTAQLEVWKEELLTAGGLFGPRTELREVGVQLLSNHHLLAEDLFADRVLRSSDGDETPEGERALAALEQEDEALHARLTELAAEIRPFERAAVLALTEVGSREGARVYELARALAAPDLSRWRGRTFESGDGPPEQWLRSAGGNARFHQAWEEFFELQANGLRRYGTYARLRRTLPEGDPDEAAERVARWIVDLEAERHARWAAFTPEAKKVLGLNVPLIALMALVVAGASALIARFLLRRRPRGLA